MKKTLFFFVLCALVKLATSQEFQFIHAVQWTDVPAKHVVNPLFSEASAVGILDDRSIEYKVEGKEIAMYTTYHYIIHVNDDKGIEMYNKIYVPMGAESSITGIKARTVLADGKVVDLPADKIKETEEEGRKYKLFAMEGVTKGSEVEYRYTIKKALGFFGTEVYQSAAIACQEVKFLLSVPQHLKFDVKGYNGFKISADSIIGEQRIVTGHDENIPEIEEEKYSARDPFLKRVEYKLSYNVSGNNDVRMYTWKEFAKKAYAFYTTSLPKDEKPILNLINAMKIDRLAGEEDKVLAVEDYIKSAINIDKNLVGDEAGMIDRILKSKNANADGITRLFSAIFEKLGISYQVVFPGKRDELPLDEEIENWNRIESIIFYFPNTNKYLAPASVELRYPFIPPYWAGARGLFLKGTTIGSYKTAIGIFGDIAMEPFEKHAINMALTVKFDATLDTLLINSQQVLKGYGATTYRPIYTFLPKDKQDEASREIIKAVAKSDNISNIHVDNTPLSSFSQNKPLIIAGDIKTVEMTERAGNKILLKVGELIGPQEQMYQEKPRQLPIELAYPHTLERKIALTIPEGYSVKNMQDLNMNIVHKDGEELTMGFVSSYAQTGNVIDILVTETYKKLKYPLNQFDEFKKVINAAADFNKVVLVLEKK